MTDKQYSSLTKDHPIRDGLSVAHDASPEKNYISSQQGVTWIGDRTTMVQKLVEPLEKDLIGWFKTARYGDQCQMVTRLGYTYTRLTKVSPSMVRW
jgi:hypothetical protein